MNVFLEIVQATVSIKYCEEKTKMNEKFISKASALIGHKGMSNSWKHSQL